MTDRPETAVTHFLDLNPAWRRISLMAKIVSFCEPILVEAKPVKAIPVPVSLTSTTLISLEPMSSARSLFFRPIITGFAPGCLQSLARRLRPEDEGEPSVQAY